MLQKGFQTNITFSVYDSVKKIVHEAHGIFPNDSFEFMN